MKAACGLCIRFGRYSTAVCIPGWLHFPSHFSLVVRNRDDEEYHRDYVEIGLSLIPDRH